MPGRGRAGGRGAGRGAGQGHDGDGSAGKSDGGVGMNEPENRGRSEWSPGHQKKAAGEDSARDWAPGHGGQPPGQVGRNSGENATETPELDSLDREA